MSFRDRLVPASFRGVKFFVDSHDYEFGPKNIVHEFPFRDDAELENQGKFADGFTINGYVIANKDNNQDYFKQRDDLIKALKDTTAGTLVHRYLGEHNVAVDGKARMSETFSEGGIARFQMTFKEIGVPKFNLPKIIINPKGYLDRNAFDTMRGVVDNAGKQLGSLPSLANLDTLQYDINTGFVSILASLRELKSLPGSIIASATGALFDVLAVVDSVLSSPCDLVNSVVDGFNGFLFAAGMLEDSVTRDVFGACSGRLQNPLDALRNADELTQAEGIPIVKAVTTLALFGDTLPQINVVSPASAKEQANRQAIVNTFRTGALTTASRIMTRITYESQDDANGLLLFVSEFMDGFLEYLGDEAGDDSLSSQQVPFSNDEVYTGIKQLKSALKKSMDAIGADLANIVDYQVGNEVISPLILAYSKYKDIDRNLEIVNRNPLLIPNPCFLPNGKTISILSE